ncbi:MAG: OmpA family protein [Bacteroidota bacterium]
MTTIIFKRMLCTPYNGTRKFIFLPVYLVFLFVIPQQTARAQVCDKKTMVFFESDKSSVQETEEKKLRDLTGQFSQKTDTFLLEVYAFTDSIASVDYNNKLARKRFNSIVSYIKKNSACQFEILEKVRGEATPLSTNATEEGRAKNRRVEIFYFKINKGRVKLKGKGGMSLAVRRDYFAPRGICECNPRITEIYTDEQAARAGIGLTTADGCPLTTGGMIGLTFDGQDANKCTDMIIEIPGAKFDEEMEIWDAAQVAGGQTLSQWFKNSGGQLDYDENTKLYTLTVKLCPGNMINLDKIASRARGGRCADSAGVIAVPELSRFKSSRNFRIVRSTILSREGQKSVTVAKFPYRGRGRIFFADSGLSADKIGYSFSGNIEKYVMDCDSARCPRLKECWCYEIPLSDYTKIIYFQKKKNFLLKVPMKYRNHSVRLFIPGADSIIPVANVKGSKRKFTFQQPLPNTYVVLYKEGSNANNKRGYDYQVDLDKVKQKYSKRKKVFKARIKKRQLKHAV